MDKLHKLIGELKKKPLSDDEVLKLVDGKANFIVYPDLHKYKNIDQVLDPHGAAIILYETKKNYGHYTGIIKTEKDKVEHFDSYGLKPDTELKFIPEHFRRKSNQDHTHLIYLLNNSSYKIEYNNKKLQKNLKDVATCGRHVACRINWKHIPLEEYIDIFKNNGYFSPDDLAVALTLSVR